MKVKHIRPQYSDLKECIQDPVNAYIGRFGGSVRERNPLRYPPQNSEWANRFKISKHGDRDKVLQLYEGHIEQKLLVDEGLEKKLMGLRGKQLGCWCVDAPTTSAEENAVCHGQILLQMIKKAGDRKGS